ncbi:MAG: restriction endonuclease subunit S [Candidatus Acidiferrales bacterium]
MATIERNGGFRSDSLQTYGGESPEKLILRPGELYVSLKDVTQSADLLGAVARVPIDIKVGRLTQDTVKLEPKDADTPLDYLYWLMRTPQYRGYCRAHATGTTNLGLARDDFLSFPAPQPTADQLILVELLNELDKHSQLNRRMNETLEAMARAIFQSWFVDFDPVRAKAAGRQPFGMDAATAALFPNSFGDSLLGKIPKGWRVHMLPEIVEVNPSRSLAKGAESAYLDMQNMPTRGHRAIGWIRRAFASGSRFSNGDTLVARITPCLENGKTAFVDFLNEGEIGWGSTEFIVLRPKDPLPPEYAYCLARDEEFRDHAIQNMTGSSGRQRVPTDCFAQYLLVAPSEPVAKRFGEIVRPLFQRAKVNSEESSVLSALRDTLLPKLISGEVRVKQAEELIEAKG